MKKMTLSIDLWENNFDKGEKNIDLFSIELAISYLKLLNEGERTMLTISCADNSCYLLICGGKKFIVNIVIGNDEGFYNLKNPKYIDDETEVEVITGGQAGLFEKKYVVDFDLAKRAMTYYFENQKPNPKLQWEEDI